MLNVYSGTIWQTVDKPLVWDGTAWKHRSVSYWDGLEWQNQAVIAGNYATTTVLSWDVAAPSVPPPPPTQTYTATRSFAATWGASYRANGTKRTDKTNLYQGYVDSYNGNQKSLCGFAVTGIPAGATIVSATVTLYANHWYNNSGGTAVIGTHTNASEPGSSPGGLTTNRLQYKWNAKTGQRTISLGTTVGAALLSGSAKGLVFGPAPSTSAAYYGYFEADGSLRPTITLKYSWVA